MTDPNWLEYIKGAQIVVVFIITLFTAGSGLIYWFHRRMKATAAEVGAQLGLAQAQTSGKLEGLGRDMSEVKGAFKDVRRELDEFEHRLMAVEATVQALPSREDIHNLTVSMTRMEGHIDRLDERLKPVSAMMERIQELLIQRGKDAVI